MKCIFIYNPNSGQGLILKYLNYIETEFKKVYDEVVMRGTKSKEDLHECVKAACQEFDVIAFSGGDGTFNDVANIVCREEKRPILAYIPSGTVNDIARNLKIPRNIKKAVKVITKGKVIYHDAGLANDQYFIYVIGTGTFTNVSYETKQSVKKVFGKLAYVFDGFEQLFNPRLVQAKIVCHDTGETFEGEYPLILVLNSKTCGGFPIDRDGHLNDGYFDIICVKKLYKLHSLNIINLFIIGARKKRLVTSFYQMARSKDFSIEVPEKYTWTVDGEKGMDGKVEVKNLHNYLRIIVPMKKNSKPKSHNLLPNKETIEENK